MASPNSVVELLQALVRLPSVNPFALDSASRPYLGEARCANFIAEFLQDLRAEVSLEEVEPDRPNVIGRFPSDQPGKPRVLLGPHIDTVSVDGMTIDPFAAEVRDGKLYGRGAADTKGHHGGHALGTQRTRSGSHRQIACRCDLRRFHGRRE